MFSYQFLHVWNKIKDWWQLTQTADSTVEQLHILPKLGSTGVEQLREEQAKDRFFFPTLAMFFEADKYAMLYL